MRQARNVLDEAHEKYQHTLAGGMEITDPNEDEMLAVRQAGRAYALALTQYSNATMAWLTYVDTHLHPKKAGEAH